jgi:LEA14-like dessication related protein
MAKLRTPALILCFVLAAPACKTPPAAPSQEEPRLLLAFDRIEGENAGKLSLLYRLRLENSGPETVTPVLSGWALSVNGLDLVPPQAALGSADLPGIAPGESRDIPLRLDLDLEEADIPAYAAGEGRDDYAAALKLTLHFEGPRGRTTDRDISAAALFPRVRKPEFTITEIAILQAELINTRLRVKLRIDNPNPFPVELSSFGYELYGAGRFWAEGRETELLRIPAGGSAETRLFLLMNFINMKRDLLDEVIAMRRVLYRFTGEALIGTGVSWLPEFRMRFDCQGRSEVLK